LTSFVRAPGKTALQPGELVHHVTFPRLPQGAVTTFQRLGSRAGMAVSIASVAAAVTPARGARPPSVRLALGAVAPTPIRCLRAERILHRWPFSPTEIEQAARTASLECHPIDDVRASAAYRRHAVLLLTRQALLRAAESASRKEVAVGPWSLS
jgi:CO/xanthine dehydrogenase FAD-binding subunit